MGHVSFLFSLISRKSFLHSPRAKKTISIFHQLLFSLCSLKFFLFHSPGPQKTIFYSLVFSSFFFSLWHFSSRCFYIQEVKGIIGPISFSCPSLFLERMFANVFVAVVVVVVVNVVYRSICCACLFKYLRVRIFVVVVVVGLLSSQ